MLLIFRKNCDKSNVAEQIGAATIPPALRATSLYTREAIGGGKQEGFAIYLPLANVKGGEAWRSMLH